MVLLKLSIFRRGVVVSRKVDDFVGGDFDVRVTGEKGGKDVVGDGIGVRFV